MKKSLCLSLLLLLALAACKDEKDSEPKFHPIAEELAGLWTRDASIWKYFDESGTEKAGFPWDYSDITKYDFTSQGDVQVTFRDGSGLSTTYELSDRDGKPYIELPDGYGPSSKSYYLVEAITEESILLVATYADMEYTDSETLEDAMAARAVNTVTLSKD